MKESELILNKALDYLKNLKLGDVQYNAKIQKLYMKIYESRSLILKIEQFADAYSFNQETPENGYFSIIDVYLIAVRKSLRACDKPKSFFIRLFMTKSKQIKNLENHAEILDNFLKMFRTLIDIHANNKKRGSLITDEGNYDNALTRTYNDINVARFYGQNIGFHHKTPTKLQSMIVGVALSTFADYYYSGKSFLIRFLKIPFDFIYYAFYPSKCALKNEEILRNSDVDFIKFICSIFTLKISCFFQNLFHHDLKVNKMIKISPEPIQIQSTKFNGKVDIPLPNSHVGIRPIPCRLLSATSREGMVGEKSKNEPSKYLIIHTHGGGFHTHTSQSHEVYLREIAAKIDVPILAIEYTLTPEAAFPRALEEVFYVYCWALKSARLLGSTAERILLIGDSAGANLSSAMIIKCIEMGVPIPHSLFTIYGLFLSNYSTIPSMMLTFMDLFLGYGHMLRIYQSYAGYHKKFEGVRDGKIPKITGDEFKDPITKSHLMSPIFASTEILSQFPPVTLLTTNIDPCMDENIEMAKKLRAAGVDVKLEILNELVHGFLHLVRICRKSYEGSAICVQHMKDLLDIE